ncbi:PAS domain S-box protein [Desulfovibrio aerotolerans]|uniref:histidine kinase n=1 Tax=Solidesulfovibrio aerotolerans TaxID=295255 RepID=A0A7C9IVJ4_9BACT|nr:PAS domain-containing hybrid sensor histidine kinase/response regulator [Solidesulfovibrio aerotolerans]MYL82702.1 PAS domain S-box protein [Solidesulfovibrio aerotolerans]
MTTYRQNTHRFPVRFALALFGAGLALYAALGWLVLTTSRTAAAFHDVELMAEEALNQIRAASDGLHALMLLRLGTGEQRYAVAYRERSAALAAPLETLHRLAPQTAGRSDPTGIEAHLRQLGTLQAEAMAQAAAAPDQAWETVRGRAYAVAQAELQACLERCHAALDAGMDALLARQQGLARAGLAALAVGMPLLGVCFALLLRRAVLATRISADAQAALAASEQRFRATFELAAVGIAHVSLDGTLLRVNSRFEGITGYSGQELAALTFAAITHPDDLNEDLRQLARLQAGEISTYTLDKRYVRKDGALVWVSLTVSLMRDEAGIPLYCIAVIADISARIAAEAAARENAAAVTTLLNAASDRVLVVDTAGRILGANDAAATGLQTTPGALLGLSLGDVFPLAIARLRLAHLRRALEIGQPVRFTDERAGIVFDNIIAPLPSVAGASDRAVLFARDATEFVRAREAAEAASRAKSDFMANVSHELRTPLNGILGMAQLLEISPLEPGQRQWLADLTSAADSLLMLVDNLLKLARIDAERFVLARQPVVLASLLEGVAGTLTPVAAQKGLTFTTQLAPDVPRLVLGDGERLREVLEHLAGNAVKFTVTGGVTVAVACARPCRLPGQVGQASPVDQADQTDQVSQAGQAGPMDQMGQASQTAEIIFAVRDTGIGIAAADQARIFDDFTQVDGSSTRRFGGVGLGLTISRRLVGLMGGEITVASEPGKGSVFSFAVCLEVPAEENAS